MPSYYFKKRGIKKKLLEKEDITMFMMIMKFLFILIYKVVLIIGFGQFLYFAYTIIECAINIFVSSIQ